MAKYCDNTPLYRQSMIYGRAGVELERSTLADRVGQAAFLLEPLATAITRHVRAGAALHADDTGTGAGSRTGQDQVSNDIGK